ncbi:MAG TPA: STAS domain-containing protein [Pseudonocardia sp.]
MSSRNEDATPPPERTATPKSRVRTRLVTHSRDRATRLLVTGQIDLETLDEFDQAVINALRAHSRLIVDLTGAQFLASVGIRTLWLHLDQITAVLVAADSMIARALSICGFPKLVIVPPSVGGGPIDRPAVR